MDPEQTPSQNPDDNTTQQWSAPGPDPERDPVAVGETMEVIPPLIRAGQKLDKAQDDLTRLLVRKGDGEDVEADLAAAQQALKEAWDERNALDPPQG